MVRGATLGALLGALLAVGIGCDGKDGDTGQLALAVGPELSHTPPEGELLEGEALALELTAADEDGVEGVTLYYRVEGADFWSSVDLEASGDDAWAAEIPGEGVRAPRLEYYFKAEDQAELSAVSYLPEDNAQAPFGLPVVVVGAPLPYEADFEIDESGGDDLYAQGWLSVTTGFAGYPFELTDARAASGEIAVFHPRGYKGVQTLDDWLVSPPLDLSGLAQIQVTWQEYGAATAGADHSLWISTGSPDPSDGDFVEVTALQPPPEGDWGRSQLVDLSAWSGEEAAWLAWRYVGSYADDWYLDAVSVRELTADIGISLVPPGETFHPGDTVTLGVTLDNRSPVDAGALTVTLELPEGAGSLDADTQSVDGVASGGAAELDFQLTVDEAWPDNSYLDLVVTVTDGPDTWSEDFQVVVGLASEGRVSVLPTDGGYVEILLGVGDPAAPGLEERVYADVPEPGPLTVSVDLTDYYAWLPPAAGEDRWYARVVTETDLSVTAFEIDHGDTTHAATALIDLLAGEEGVVWLPEPPEPALDQVDTSPSTVEPGDRGVALTLSLSNLGAATAGPVTATLTSADPDAVVTGGGPLPLTAEPWAAGAAAQVGPFTVDVAEGHTSSIDLALELLLDDGVEQWTVPVPVPVPWVVMRVQGITIDDSGGDGLLDPGESATLAIELGNVGDLDSDGPAEATLRLATGSAVSATLGGEEANLGLVDAGDAADAEFTLSVDAGASAGQALDLVIEISDDRATYTAPLQIVLGETPWLFLSSTDDAVGDSFGYTFDLTNAMYRVVDGELQVRVLSAAAFDAGTAYVEIFGLGSGDSSFFRVTSQSGDLTVQDYSSGFKTVYSGAATYPDASSIQLAWPVEAMGLTGSTLQVGLGAGWCSSETGNFCDHFPDGWEHYFTGFIDSDFFTIRTE